MKDTHIHHNNNFNLLRHLAALMVVYAHCLPAGQVDLLYRITHGRVEYGNLGVEIFFIISGYLVTKSLLNTDSKWHFARKRLLRIWPALLVVTTFITFLIGPLLSTYSIGQYFTNPDTWFFYFRNILFLPVFQLPGVFNGSSLNSSFWTLFFEVVCYGVLLVIGKRVLLRLRWLIAGVWLMAAIYKYWFFPVSFQFPDYIKQYIPGIYSLMFLFFSSSAWCLCEKKVAVPGRKIWVLALAIFVISCALPLGVPMLRDMALMLSIVGWGKSAAIFKWPLWDISYGVYLISGGVTMVLIHYAIPISQSRPILLMATLAITLPLAFTSWYFIEKPALDKK